MAEKSPGVWIHFCPFCNEHSESPSKLVKVRSTMSTKDIMLSPKLYHCQRCGSLYTTVRSTMTVSGQQMVESVTLLYVGLDCGTRRLWQQQQDPAAPPFGAKVLIKPKSLPIFALESRGKTIVTPHHRYSKEVFFNGRLWVVRFGSLKWTYPTSCYKLDR